MKKLYTVKGFVLGVVCTLIVAMLAVSAVAFTGNQEAILSFRDIKITFNDNEIIPKDADGNVVEPFIIEGTTYLPVRAVSGALGLGVSWDGDTSTVKLTDSSYSPAETPSVDGGIELTGATFANNYGSPRLTVDYTNHTGRGIARFDITINCFDAYMEPVFGISSNTYNGYTLDPIGVGVSDSIYWDLFGFSGAYYVEFAIVKYTTTDGSIVEIPEASQEWYSASM